MSLEYARVTIKVYSNHDGHGAADDMFSPSPWQAFAFRFAAWLFLGHRISAILGPLCTRPMTEFPQRPWEMALAKMRRSWKICWLGHLG